MTLLTMWDSIDARAIPANAQAAAGYIDGMWPSYAGIRAKLPSGVPVVSITVSGRPGARVADVENGDLTPVSFAAWARAELEAGRRPTCYTSKGQVPAVVAALEQAHIDPGTPLQGGRGGFIDWWPADWGAAAGRGVVHLLGGCVATQYDHDVQGCDVSTVDAEWLTGEGEPHMLNAPVVAVVVDHLGAGYWDVAADGGVFTHGPHLPFMGAATGQILPGDHVVDAGATPDGGGYTLVTAAGRHYDFGNAPFEGNDP